MYKFEWRDNGLNNNAVKDFPPYGIAPRSYYQNDTSARGDQIPFQTVSITTT